MMGTRSHTIAQPPPPPQPPLETSAANPSAQEQLLWFRLQLHPQTKTVDDHSERSELEEQNLLKSFIEHRDERGVHFYDAFSIEWVAWDRVFEAVQAMNLPEDAADKIIESMANYDAKNEFVSVRVGSNGLTIEVFKASELR